MGELSEVEHEVGPPYHFPDALEILGAGEVNRPRHWDELTAEQRQFQATKMELHAAMINVGKAVDGVASARINLEAIRRDQGLG